MFPFQCIKYHFKALIFSISAFFLGGKDSFMFLFLHFIHQRVWSWTRLSRFHPDLLICVTLAPHRYDFQNVLRASSKRLHPPPPAPPSSSGIWWKDEKICTLGPYWSTSYLEPRDHLLETLEPFSCFVLAFKLQDHCMSVAFVLTSACSLNCIKSKKN